MAFPPSFLDEIRLRVSLAETIGRRVKLARKGREFLGLCPFHNEKTPSFTVNEDKGFFHCFGCGEHGDVISFVQKTDNLTFPEAVARLAEQAGLQMPQQTPEDRERESRRATLRDVLDTAAQWYRSQLAGEHGKSAREYLTGRGLSAETVKRFALGFAPDRRTALKEALLARGLDEALLVESGMLIKPDDGGATFDRFRNRIMFPIWDHRGQVIAFGGRALGDARAKYLNSPETPVFHKGDILYGLHLARDKARDSGGLIVAEGYMDVIAMAAAGLENAVAPLGTALTESQMRQMWRLVPEPVLCLDGDAAGMRAGLRAADRCLAELKPGLSLSFALLPGGQDPDDMIRDQGVASLESYLANAVPLSEMLWRSETDGHRFETPERRAALQQSLRKLTDRIADPTVQSYYKTFFNEKIREIFGGDRTREPDRRRNFNRAPYDRRKLSPAVAQSFNHGEQVLMAGVLNHPAILESELEVFAGITFSAPELDRLKDAILEISAQSPDLDSSTLKGHLAERGFASIVERLAGRDARVLERFVRSDAQLSDAHRGWKRVLALHRRNGLQAELKSLQAELGRNPDKATWERFCKLQALLARPEGVDEAV